MPRVVTPMVTTNYKFYKVSLIEMLVVRVIKPLIIKWVIFKRESVQFVPLTRMYYAFKAVKVAKFERKSLYLSFACFELQNFATAVFVR